MILKKTAVRATPWLPILNFSSSVGKTWLNNCQIELQNRTMNLSFIDFVGNTFDLHNKSKDNFNSTSVPLDDATQLEYCEPLNSSIADQEIEDDNILLNFIAYGVLLNVIGIFGILGNIISMIILSRPQMKSSINYLLIGLARCDTVLIITSILLFGLPSVYSATGYLFTYYHKVYPLIAPFVYPIAMISQTVSVYLTLIVTVERFVAVCHPLQARSLCTCGRARLYVILVIIFSVLYNITRFWEVDVQPCLHNILHVTIYRVYPSFLRNNETYIKIYIHWMYLIFMYFIPFGFLSVLNTAIYRQVSNFKLTIMIIDCFLRKYVIVVL